MEPTEERRPRLPSGPQILGLVLGLLGLKDERLSTRTAGRYLAGHRVKDASVQVVHMAAADVLMQAGLAPMGECSEDDQLVQSTIAGAVASAIHWWDSTRAMLHRRVSLVEVRNLPELYAAFLRLAAVDLALRIGAHAHLRGQSSSVQLRELLADNATGRYLNQLRQRCDAPKLTTEDFSDKVGVDPHSVDRWLYEGDRPKEGHLQKIAEVLAGSTAGGSAKEMLRAFRQVYLVRDALGLVGTVVGREAAGELASQLVSIADGTGTILGTGRYHGSAVQELALRGSNAAMAPTIIAKMGPICSGEWATDLDWVCGRWIPRLQQVYHTIRDREQDEAIERSAGKLLEQWGVTHPEAYRRYQRSAELQAMGRMDEALAELRAAIAVDPCDPVPHCTLGSALSGIGRRTGRPEMMEEGLRECWIAIGLDRTWLLPWVEVGWILIESNKMSEARAHLESFPEPPDGFDVNYYQALGTACGQDLAAALAAYEQAIALDPDDALIYMGASSCAFRLGDSVKGLRYAKEAKRLGNTLAHDVWKARLFGGTAGRR